MKLNHKLPAHLGAGKGASAKIQPDEALTDLPCGRPDATLSRHPFCPARGSGSLGNSPKWRRSAKAPGPESGAARGDLFEKPSSACCGTKCRVCPAWIGEHDTAPLTPERLALRGRCTRRRTFKQTPPNCSFRAFKTLNIRLANVIDVVDFRFSTHAPEVS